MISRAARIVAFATLLAGPSATAAEPLKALIITGGEDHDWRQMVPVLRRALEETGRFDVRVCETPAGLNARTLADFDVLINDYAGLSTDAEARSAISGLVASGKGVVHTSGAVPRPKPSGSSAEAVRFLDVKVDLPEHPIVRGLPTSFRTADAIHLSIGMQAGSDVIATVSDRNRILPVLYVHDKGEGKGRVASLALGHDLSAIHEKEFAALFCRSAEWAATGSVMLPPDAGQPKVEPVKALIITGGHDHHAAFYSLFEKLGPLQVDTSTNAFKKDIRGKYQALIMYDFTRDLDDAGKKNLRDFVEAGGGVVVLHHALLNYQGWEWWDDEVVGGSYRLTKPSSSVKDDQQIYVTPAGDHPILKGIGPFHIQDEAYKNLRMSPKIRPLLTTDNPTSDANLAWIGPREDARVVAIQLGHGPSAFGHPSYRALVDNAVRWAAGKNP